MINIKDYAKCRLLCLLVLLCGTAGCGKVMKNNPFDDSFEPEFYWHKDVAKTAKDFNLLVKGEDLLQDLVETSKSNYDMKEYMSFHRVDHICIRTIVRAYNNSNIGDFWVLVTFGHTGNSTPIYKREELRIEITGGDFVTLDNPKYPDLPVAHGQGLPVVHFRYDFTKKSQEPTEIYKDLRTNNKIYKPIPPFCAEPPKIPKWIVDPHIACANIADSETEFFTPFEETIYTPAFPGRTGGQPQFGVYQVLPEISSDGYRLGSWRSQLYQEACRPGHFLHPDGTRATEDDYPKTVLHSNGWFHERSKGDHWIKHTNPSAPWLDRGAKTPKGTLWRFWDSQHWSINCLCQAYHLYEDPGLEMILRDLAEGWLWANPVTNKGTSHHIPGAARARGRVLEAGCSLACVLDGDIHERLKSRVKAILDIQIKEFKNKLDTKTNPIISRRDGYSVWEHGLWVKGLAAASHLLPSYQKEIHIMGGYISRWVLDGFKDFNGKLYVPYVIKSNGTWENNPSKGLSRWCLPAIQLLDKFERSGLTKEENDKITAILEQFKEIQPPTGGGWPDSSKWNLF